jgi:hypothetical protein
MSILLVVIGANAAIPSQPEACFQVTILVFTIVGALAASAAVWVAWRQLSAAREEIRRANFPILIVTLQPHAGRGPVTFSRESNANPVVQDVAFGIRNDGNGPALNIEVRVSQGALQLERAIAPNWAARGISQQELYRNSLARSDQMDCFFTVSAGFNRPTVESPLRITVTCETVYSNKLLFVFEAPMGFLSALAEKGRVLTFREMRRL